MRKIIKPTIDIKQIVNDCILNMTDLALKAEIVRTISQIESAEIEYNLKKGTNELFQITRGTEISAIVTKKVLKEMYSDRFSKKGNAARKHYDLLILSAPNSRCPLCGVRLATTLDHNLPKSKYALLSVSALNLIPSCTDCNKGKLADFPRASNDETIHPYYDDLENLKWLSCRVLEVNPLVIEYYVSVDPGTDALLSERIINHFNSFNLNDLYRAHGLEEFSNRRIEFINLYNKGGRNLLRDHLEEGYLSRLATNINSWQSAFYEAILNDHDFTNGHFI
jgi:hypothetical protein